MSRETARIAIFNKVETLKAAWSAYTLLIEYDNLCTVNLPTQELPYLSCNINYLSAEQVNLASNPLHRAYGYILLEAWVKENRGTKLANDLLQHFFPAVHMTDSMLPVRTMAADFLPSGRKAGWVSECVSIPFHYDTLY